MMKKSVWIINHYAGSMLFDKECNIGNYENNVYMMKYNEIAMRKT